MTTRYLQIFVITLWLGILFLPVTTWSQGQKKITQANQLYNQNKFREAAETYEQMIANDIKNGHSKPFAAGNS